MIVVMRPQATDREVQQVIERMTERGLDVYRNHGVERIVLAAVGVTSGVDVEEFKLLEGVEDALRIGTPYKVVARSFHPEDTVFEVGGLAIGGEEVVVMAGPCSVESEEQIRRTAEAVRAAGARVLRGGAFKPRSSPYSFQGLAERGHELLRRAADEHGLLT
ncbi:MAG: 3-deoxy-7-phosphoheptulonate synthase, partial [Thermoanaerobaculia bacterium]